MTSPYPASDHHGCRFREALSLSVTNRDFTTGDNFARVTYPIHSTRAAFRRRSAGGEREGHPAGRRLRNPDPRQRSGSMLPDPPNEVVSHTSVQCPVSSARQDVNVKTHCICPLGPCFRGDERRRASRIWQNETNAAFWQNEIKRSRHVVACLTPRRSRARSRRYARRAAARGAAMRLACRRS
jgi:hypothetical protein